MKFIIGVDEVGRGSLAGPVVVAVVLIPTREKISNRELGSLRDSKHLTKKQREAWSEYLRSNPHIRFALARVYPRTIERMNISRAANRAALKAFERLMKQERLRVDDCRIFLDGGLYLGRRGLYPEAKTVIRGDQKIPAVKIASIIAKVWRDRLMERLSRKYPRYGFHIHKGYGTKAHLRAIRRYGASKAHRLTFLRSYVKMKR